jgi:uncharacterized membrane protein YeaQ/YmgE (transglycosylase-associated protein family)
MIESVSVFGWMAIGVAASLAAMMWPFRRGYLGVIVNLVVGPLGAVALGFLSLLFWPAGRPHQGPVHLFFAAAGALAGLGLMHVIWSHNRRPSNETS